MAKETLSKNLKNLLHKNGKTQTDMAKDLNISESTVSSWMKSVKYPRRDKIEMMAEYFGVQPSDITDDKTNHPTTTAFHLDGKDLTKEEIEDVQKYIDFIREKRNK